MTRRLGQDGFTVLELMIAMMIMLVITVPLVTAFVLGLTTTQQGKQDVSNSADGQLLAAYFDVDVSSAESVGLTSDCGDDGDAILELRWTDGGLHRVAYRAVPDPLALASVQRIDVSYSGSIKQLRRLYCSPDGDTDTLIARTLVADPEVACDGTTPGSCVGKSKPRTVSLRFEEFSNLLVDRDNMGAPGTRVDRVSFAVTAARRVTR